MRVLALDIETAPHKVYVWDLWNQNIAINQIEEPGYVMCWGAKWEDEAETQWCGLNTTPREEMLARIHALLDEAEVVVHFNGRAFDIPWLNTEFVQAGMTPPSPYKQVDLYKVATKVFRFPSNKLEYVAQALGIGSKYQNQGFPLWKRCRAGDPEAWATMERYNRRDVELMPLLYQRFLPWVPYHPSQAGDRVACPHCGSVQVQKRGTYYAITREYQRYCCQGCGAWFRGVKATATKAQVRSIGV